MEAFVAHPSVRIRGTEHTYTPVLCQDEKCHGCEKGVHMHCPLCTVKEAYQDPIILRAHFRIKHLDKGIDFAGLKVLRCCNHCEIVGTIKGEKRFKGAHWHCYRCRNGFNRRDEAVKHYKTHFRNPHTTFQIQVTQDVNCRQYYSGTAEAHVKAYSGLTVSLGSAGDTTAAILTHPVLTTSSDQETAALFTVQPKEESESNGIPLGAEEEVGSSQHASGRTQALVLMNSDGHTGSLIYDEATGIITEQSEDSLELQKRLLELNQQIETLRQEKESMEKTLQAEIKQLKDQVASLVQSNVKMFEELQAYQSQEHSQHRVTTLMESLQAQHKELLQAHLASLRQELLSQASVMTLNNHTGELSTSQDQEEEKEEKEEEQEEQEKKEDEELREQLVEFRPVPADRLDSALSTSQNLQVKQNVHPESRKRCPEDECEETRESKAARVS